MAKKNLTKTDRVRSWINKNPSGSARDAMEALSEFGVSSSDFYNTKSKMKPRKKVGNRKAVVVPAAIEFVASDVTTLRATRAIPRAIGDRKHATAALAAYDSVAAIFAD